MTGFVLQRVALLLLLGAWWFVSSGCQSTYYAALEQLGYHKRDLLVTRVKDARDSQEEAKEQFKSALEKFGDVLQFDGGALEDKYNELKAELDRSESSASAVHNRIEAVENVSEALFQEWEGELAQYTNENLRRDSARQLNAARKRYTSLMRSMKRAESKIAPVLSAFRDQVLYLKHNLNAQAIASLQGELTSIETNIDALIREMETAIAEADAFIKALGSS
ncbi:DUF2959 domain-containing protein [Candidatus Entotheonella palauensis]|uniref:DUF2959 domain-containing protein n=1 Tax=Candidatus Entotheonella palauensis TaxID=93172 RepID=UPI000B7ED5DB|nr:DUF2959 domain-containing protein [Candidatus Entotheonella palauensis]